MNRDRVPSNICTGTIPHAPIRAQRNYIFKLLLEVDPSHDIVIEVLFGEDGRIIAHSDSEPLFCIVADNIYDVHTEVMKIISSYVRHFGGESIVGAQ